MCVWGGGENAFFCFVQNVVLLYIPPFHNWQYKKGSLCSGVINEETPVRLYSFHNWFAIHGTVQSEAV